MDGQLRFVVILDTRIDGPMTRNQIRSKGRTSIIVGKSSSAH
jgi:hypothetical protein